MNLTSPIREETQETLIGLSCALFAGRKATFSFGFHHHLSVLMSSLRPKFETPFNLVAALVLLSSRSLMLPASVQRIADLS